MIEKIKKIGMIRIFIKNRGKLKDFYLSVIAGVFSGSAIGIFFRLTTDTSFNRWIDLSSFEIFAAIIYLIFVLIVLAFFYFFGILITKYLLRDKKRILNFHLNFIAGTYSSATTYLLVLYYNVPIIRNTSVIVAAVLFFILAYYTVKRKWPK